MVVNEITFIAIGAKRLLASDIDHRTKSGEVDE